MAEAFNVRYRIEDVTPEALRMLLEFVYTGSVFLPDLDAALQLLLAADSFAQTTLTGCVLETRPRLL